MVFKPFVFLKLIINTYQNGRGVDNETTDKSSGWYYEEHEPDLKILFEVTKL